MNRQTRGVERALNRAVMRKTGVFPASCDGSDSVRPYRVCLY